MDESIYDALVDLKRSVDTQIALQEQTNAILRALISTLEEAAQATDDLAEAMKGGKTKSTYTLDNIDPPKIG